MKIVSLILLVLGVGAGGMYYAGYLRPQEPPKFRTVTVSRGELISTISATGTVEPVDVVDVGAQVVGRIRDLGIDPAALAGVDVARLDPAERAKLKRIDYGSVVHEGTELASIDDSVYQAQLRQAKASLQRAEADLAQFNAKLSQTKREWQRAEELHKLQTAKGNQVKGISETEYDLAKANYEVSQANVAVGLAAVEQAKAMLELSQTNVDYTVIRSPVEGVIVDRRVNVGQTVVSSLNAPSLFLIAKDLSRVQVWASVNEADIGQIRSREKMPVRFTVDAYPGRVFRGMVTQVRLNATMTQNVVTYTVVITCDNADRTLIPYLTANVQFETAQQPDVLMVPNLALRWRPRDELLETPSAEVPSAVRSPGAPPSSHRPGGAEAKEAENRGRVWVKSDDGRHVRPLEVQIGLTDGAMTAIRGEGLHEGLELVTGEVASQSRDDEVKNPFGPPPFRKSANSPKKS